MEHGFVVWKALALMLIAEVHMPSVFIGKNECFLRAINLQTLKYCFGLVTISNTSIIEIEEGKIETYVQDDNCN